MYGVKITKQRSGKSPAPLFFWEDAMKKTILNAKWWECAGVRALKTCCQTAIALMSTSVIMSDVNWVTVGSATVLSGILSLLTSLAGLPEMEVDDE